MLFEIGFWALIEVKGSKVVLVLDSDICDLGQSILFLDSREVVKILEVIASFRLEDSVEVFLSLFNFCKWSSLVHSVLTYSSISRENDVKISY